MTNIRKHLPLMKTKKHWTLILSIILVILIISGIKIAKFFRQEMINNYPVPKIEILSNKENQGNEFKYLLKLNVTNATNLKITSESNNPIEKQFNEKYNNMIEQEIALLQPSTSISIESKNKYKSSQESLIITRDKTEQEIAEEGKIRLAEEQKRIDRIKNNMEGTTGFPIGIGVAKEKKAGA